MTTETETVRLELDRDTAEALLSYTETSLSRDDSFDEYREKIVDARDELERALSDNGGNEDR